MIETPTMRLINTMLPADSGGLARFIATRRVPGPDWKTFERIAHELYAETGFSVTRAGIQGWAKRYGIPTWRPTRVRPEPTPEQVAAYREAVARYMT